jgi:hypothetical protein
MHQNCFTDSLHTSLKIIIVVIIINRHEIKNFVFAMWSHVVLVRTDVSEEGIAFIFRMERIKEVGTALEVTSFC